MNKDYVEKVDPEVKLDVGEMENIAAIVGKIIEKRKDLGITQSELASMCGITRSSVCKKAFCSIVL